MIFARVEHYWSRHETRTSVRLRIVHDGGDGTAWHADKLPLAVHPSGCRAGLAEINAARAAAGMEPITLLTARAARRAVKAARPRAVVSPSIVITRGPLGRHARREWTVWDRRGEDATELGSGDTRALAWLNAFAQLTEVDQYGLHGRPVEPTAV